MTMSIPITFVVRPRRIGASCGVRRLAQLWLLVATMISRRRMVQAFSLLTTTTTTPAVPPPTRTHIVKILPHEQQPHSSPSHDNYHSSATMDGAARRWWSSSRQTTPEPHTTTTTTGVHQLEDVQPPTPEADPQHQDDESSATRLFQRPAFWHAYNLQQEMTAFRDVAAGEQQQEELSMVSKRNHHHHRDNENNNDSDEKRTNGPTNGKNPYMVQLRQHNEDWWAAAASPASSTSSTTGSSTVTTATLTRRLLGASALWWLAVCDEPEAAEVWDSLGRECPSWWLLDSSSFLPETDSGACSQKNTELLFPLVRLVHAVIPLSLLDYCLGGLETSLTNVGTNLVVLVWGLHQLQELSSTRMTMTTTTSLQAQRLQQHDGRSSSTTLLLGDTTHRSNKKNHELDVRHDSKTAHDDDDDVEFLEGLFRSLAYGVLYQEIHSHSALATTSSLLPSVAESACVGSLAAWLALTYRDVLLLLHHHPAFLCLAALWHHHHFPPHAREAEEANQEQQLDAKEPTWVCQKNCHHGLGCPAEQCRHVASAAVTYGACHAAQDPLQNVLSTGLSGGWINCAGSDQWDLCVETYATVNPPGETWLAQLPSLTTTLWTNFLATIPALNPV